MAQRATTQMTAAEYSSLPETNQYQELINGEVIMSPSPVSEHQRLVRRFTRNLEDSIPDGEIFFAPMDVYLDDVNVFQPDVFWVAENSDCVERDGYFYGAPDLVIEVHSPSTTKRDKQDKFETYEKHGVREYWMVDPVGKVVEVWYLEGSRFTRQGVYGADEEFESKALNKPISLENIFP